jgi:hypothetical protein
MEQPITGRCYKKEETKRAGLIFRCPEKVDHIERMCKQVSYKDIMLTIEFVRRARLFLSPIRTGPRTARVNVKFGNGWMGKNAEIRRLNFANGEPGDILVIITISDLNKFPHRCWIKNLKDKEDTVLLGEVEDMLTYWEEDEDEEQLDRMGKTLLGPTGVIL